MSAFGIMRLDELKKELRIRGEKTTGRKKEHVERLEAYDRNANFVYVNVEDQTPAMKLPNTTDYRDLTGNTCIPEVSKETLESFLKHFGVPSIPDKAIQMYHSSHLTVVRSCTNISGCYIRAVCKAELRKAVVYNLDLLISSNGEITESQCECAAGKGPFAYCKHLITLIIGVHDFSKSHTMTVALSKTEKLQSFHCPRKEYTGSPIKAEVLPLKRFKIDSTKTKENTGIGNVQFDPRPIHMRNNPGCNDFVRSICVNYAYNEPHFPMLQLFGSGNMYAVESDHDYLKNSLSDLCLERLHILGSISTDYKRELELSTRGQANNSNWVSEKHLRITSSNFGTICKVTERRDLKKLAKSLLDHNELHSKAILHGRQYEDVALKRYQEITDKVVVKCGLFVCEDRPYMAASPDALVGEDGLVEIKCPYTTRDKVITPENIPYLTVEHGELRLKKNHNYYYQIQGQMLATGRNNCDFVVYTFKDFVFMNIPRDDEFVADIIKNVENFYEQYFKDALKDKFFYLKRE